jgi:hypothetical protein
MILTISGSSALIWKIGAPMVLATSVGKGPLLNSDGFVVNPI